MTQIKARVMQLTKTFDEWMSLNPVILNGEWAVTKYVDSGTGAVSYKVKIGDGVKTYSALPFGIWSGETSGGTDVGTSFKADIVVEKPTYNDFPNVGEPNTIYIDLSNNGMYRWSATGYVLLNDEDGTITIRDLSQLDDYKSNLVSFLIWLLKKHPTSPTTVSTYTLRVEVGVGVINQFLENRNGYQYRTYYLSTNTWSSWSVVIMASINDSEPSSVETYSSNYIETVFSTKEDLANALGDIETLLGEI